MSIFDMEQPEDENVVDVQEGIEGRTFLQIEDKSTASEDDATEDADGGAEAVDVADEETIDVPDENGAEGDTEACDDDYFYDDPGYDEPC